VERKNGTSTHVQERKHEGRMKTKAGKEDIKVTRDEDAKSNVEKSI
jgi:hypothetical protein